MTPNDISTPKKAEDVLADLQRYAQDAAAARLGQMHAHLVLMPKASGHDGTAAQVHDYYAQALAPIVQALRAQAEAEANRERTYRLALLGLQRQDTKCWCYTLTGGHAPECLQARAALAQAGGEG